MTERPDTAPATARQAAYHLAGDVQRRDEDIQTRVRLVRTANGQVVWSTSYASAPDVPPDPAPQASIIGKFVRLQLVRDQQCQAVRRRSRIAEAADLVCAAQSMNYRINQRGRFDPELLRATAERAVALDENLLEGYQLLPTAYYFLTSSGRLTRGEASRLAHRALDRALAIDPDDAYTLWSVGFIQALLDFRYEAADRTLQRAIANDPLHPNARRFHAARALVAKRRGDLAAALPHYRRAIALYDSDGRIHAEYAEALMFSAQHRDAIGAAETALALSPYAISRYSATRSKCLAHLALGERTAAAAVLDDYLRTAEPPGLAKQPPREPGPPVWFRRRIQ